MSSRRRGCLLVALLNDQELFELDRIKGLGPVVTFSSDGKHILRGSIGKLLNWSLSSRREPGPIGDEEFRSTVIGWHATQLKIAADSHSAFAFDFHYKQLRSLAQSASVGAEDTGTESELFPAMSHASVFFYLNALAREQLAQHKDEAYRKTCQLLLKESLVLLKRDKNYAFIRRYSTSLTPSRKGAHSEIRAAKIYPKIE